MRCADCGHSRPGHWWEVDKEAQEREPGQRTPLRKMGDGKTLYCARSFVAGVPMPEAVEPCEDFYDPTYGALR